MKQRKKFFFFFINKKDIVKNPNIQVADRQTGSHVKISKFWLKSNIQFAIA